MNVLVEKYDWDPMVAKDFADFLLPMLEYNPVIRASAAECLKQAWIKRDTANDQNECNDEQKEAAEMLENYTECVKPVEDTVV